MSCTMRWPLAAALKLTLTSRDRKGRVMSLSRGSSKAGLPEVTQLREANAGQEPKPLGPPCPCPASLLPLHGWLSGQDQSVPVSIRAPRRAHPEREE